MAKTKGSVSVSSSPDMAAPDASGASDSAISDVYQDDIELYLQEFFDLRHIDPVKVSSMQWAAALMHVCNRMFKHDRDSLRDSHDKARYDIAIIDSLVDRYIALCYLYNQRICVEHFSFLSGIPFQTLYSWQNDRRPVYIYKNRAEKGLLGTEKLTITKHDIYKKLVQNTVIAADDLLLTKAGVNSIAYRNAVQERYASRAADQVQALDVGSIADQLGIAGDVALIDGSSK